MKNTLWVFGDSFTMGHGCASWYPSEYTKLYPKGDEYMWPNLLAKDLNLNVENLGFAGNSNSSTLRILTQNIHKLKKGDYVILGITDSYRFEIPYYDKMKNILISTNKLNDLTPGFEEDKYAQESLERYVKSFQIPYYKTLDKEVMKSIDSIKKFLNDTEIKTLSWRYIHTSNSDYFINIKPLETIEEHTKGKINDTHLSWNGHYEFYKKIIKLIQKI